MTKQKDMARYGRHFDTTKWDYEPTGLLSLLIGTWAFEGIRKNWNDGKSKVVEDGLKEFLINLVTIADLKRQRGLEDAERERRRQEDLKTMQELERRRQEELRRLQDLENQAVRWTKAAQLRAYVAEVEKKACSSDLPAEEQELVISWLRWAREHADRIDPLIGDAWKGLSMPKDS